MTKFMVALKMMGFRRWFNDTFWWSWTRCTKGGEGSDTFGFQVKMNCLILLVTFLRMIL